MLIDNLSLLVKIQAASRQVLEEEKQKGEIKGSEIPTGQIQKPAEEAVPEPKSKQFKRFYGRVELDSLRVSRDAGQIAEEVIQHLAALPSSDVKVSLEITANILEGIPEKTVRVLIENCKTLKFKENAFEE